MRSKSTREVVLDSNTVLKACAKSYFSHGIMRWPLLFRSLTADLRSILCIGRIWKFPEIRTGHEKDIVNWSATTVKMPWCTAASSQRPRFGLASRTGPCRPTCTCSIPNTTNGSQPGNFCRPSRWTWVVGNPWRPNISPATGQHIHRLHPPDSTFTSIRIITIVRCRIPGRIMQEKTEGNRLMLRRRIGLARSTSNGRQWRL